MTRKTKKEKIIAAYRKKLKLLQKQQLSTTVSSPVKSAPSETIMLETKPQVTISDKNYLSISYFVSDLKKSLSLIIFIIALEIFLYFATIKQYLRFF